MKMPPNAVNYLDNTKAEVAKMLAGMQAPIVTSPPAADDGKPPAKEPPQPVERAKAQPVQAVDISSGDIQEVPLTDILIDELQFQLRADGTDRDHIDSLVVQLENGVKFHPAKIIRLGDGSLILTHGHHRYFASKQHGLDTLTAIVIDGTLEDAFLDALDAGAITEKQRTPADKRRAVEMLLTHETLGPQWLAKSDRAIARKCGSTAPTVKTIKQKLAQAGDIDLPDEDEPILVERGGTTYEAERPKAKSTQPDPEPQPKEDSVATSQPVEPADLTDEQIAQKIEAYFKDQEASFEERGVALTVLQSDMEESATLKSAIGLSENTPNFTGVARSMLDKLSESAVDLVNIAVPLDLLPALRDYLEASDEARIRKLTDQIK